MSKIFGFYVNNVDKMWYDSSNVKYSECIDHDNELKTLKVVFKNGTQYQYNKVKVNDYLMFRESVSQGKGLNEYIKSKDYSYEKLENANMEELDDELSFRANGGVFVNYFNGKFTMKDNKDNVICEKEIKLTKDAFNLICSVLTAVGKNISADGNNFVDENNEDYTSIIEEKPF